MPLNIDKRLEISGRKLSNPIKQEWPLLSEDIDSRILETLDTIFQQYKSCLRSVKKTKKPPKQQSSPPDSLTEEEIKQRNKFKSQFVVGVNKVIKGLERNELCLVLVSRTTQPPMLIQTILSLVVSVSCPAACVSNLLTTVQQSWPGLTSLTSMGIKKKDILDDFNDLVQYVKSDAVPALCVPELKQKSAPSYADENTSDTITTENNCSDSASRNMTASESDKTKDLSEKLKETDPTKYYVYKSDISTQKSFQGQDFIEFDKDDVVHINVVDGKISENLTIIHDMNIFGIAPPFCNYVSKEKNIETEDDEAQGRKRSLDSSSYKGITIKQAKRDEMSQKKKKKKPKQSTRVKKSKAS